MFSFISKFNVFFFKDYSLKHRICFPQNLGSLICSLFTASSFGVAKNTKYETEKGIVYERHIQSDEDYHYGDGNRLVDVGM